VIYLETLGSKWIVLNSLKACTDLLEKRGTKYSDRPRFVLNEVYVLVIPWICVGAPANAVLGWAGVLL
jgi:hypothetical protein